MIRALVLAISLAAPQPLHAAQQQQQGFRWSIQAVPASLQSDLTKRKFWNAKCPVGLSSLRVLTVTYTDFAGRPQTGQLVVNQSAARPLAHVFRKLYELRFPIRHMHLQETYGPRSAWPADNDPSASFQCRQAVPSPCTGGKGTGSWSMHAYGLAIDINPVENPYVGCGESRDPASRPYRNRSRLRKGMVTPGVLAAFRSIGWAWGGSWSGSTKDYMHFSATGH
ncbi:MAG: M15 family metallopeptidase [Thermoleophilaceae bacterium]